MRTAAGATELSQNKRLTTAKPRAAAGAEPAGHAAGGRAALGFRRATRQAKTIKSPFSLGWAAPLLPRPKAHSGCQRSPSRPRAPPHLTGRSPGVPTPRCAVPRLSAPRRGQTLQFLGPLSSSDPSVPQTPQFLRPLSSSDPSAPPAPLPSLRPT